MLTPVGLLDLVRGCTFDDFLFTPQYSVVERRDPAALDLTSHFSRRLSLKRPIVSANMDTVTRAEMAIAVAEEGGIGIIDRGFRSGEIEPQVREVQIVKRKQHGVIAACGLTGGIEVTTTVMPFILRGVSLLGIDSVQCPYPLRRKVWARLAADLRPRHLDAITHTVPFEQLPEVFEALLKGAMKGRTVVKIE